MYSLTAADFADTGQWRLLLNIWPTGLEAFLENTIHPEIQPQSICQVSWELNKDKLRENIEDAVYKNTRLLDDFATRIRIFDPRTLFIPSEIVDDSFGAEEELYMKVYTADPADIMTDRDDDITAAWCLAPGVKGFLLRTFPGARISCNLLEQVRNFRKNNNGLKLFADARKNEVDMILLDGSNLISASTHEWRHPDDIAYLALNLLEVYGRKHEDCKVETIGFPTDSEAWNFIFENSSH